MKPLRGPVLLVEDDPDIREALEAFLQVQEVPVRTAPNGKVALELLAQEPGCSLVLLDMALPVMDGHRLLTARKASDTLRAIPVVIVSAGMAVMSPRDLAVYASSFDVAALVKKPWHPDQLLETIARHALPAAAGSDTHAVSH